jgi:SAM-dependent methyltransferase
MDAEVFRVHAEVEQKHWWFVARRQILRAVVEAVVPPDRSRRIVDLGCGVGATVPAFHPDYTYIGYEPSAIAVHFARDAHPGVEFHVGTAASAAADLAHADVVLLTDVIEHVASDRALLTAAIEPMAPGSWLLVTVPAGMELWSPHDEALGHYRRYDVEMMQATWAGLPVRPALLTHFNARLYLPVRAVRWLTSHLNHAAGAGGTDFSVPPRPVNAGLHRLFGGEAKRLVAMIHGQRPAYRRGVSILAMLQRQSLTAPDPSTHG